MRIPNNINYERNWIVILIFWPTYFIGFLTSYKVFAKLKASYVLPRTYFSTYLYFRQKFN